MMNLLWSFLIPILLLCCQGEMPQTTIYLQYPIMGHGSGEGGSFYRDLTMHPPRPVFFLVSENSDSIRVSSNISDFLIEQPDSSPIIDLKRDNDGFYRYRSGEQHEAGTITIAVNIEGTSIRGADHKEFVLGDSGTTFILTPFYAPDPRNQDVQRCGNGAQIRLSVDDTARINSMSRRLTLFEQVNTVSSIDVFVDAVDVVAGPLCVDEVAWWQVRLQEEADSVAWIPEMTNEGTYLTTPIRSKESLSLCHHTLTSRLNSGAFVSPIPDTEIPLYMSADESSHIVVNITANDVYRVVSESTCQDGMLWWEVEQAERRGWVREMDITGYQIQPSSRVELSAYLQELTFQG